MIDYWEKQEKKKINAKKIIAIIIMFIFITAIIVFTSLYMTNKEFRDWIDIHILKKEIFQNNVTTIEIDESQKANVYAFNKYIGILNKNKLSLYSSIGTEEASLEVQVTNPNFYSSNRFLIIGEKNGHKLYVIENKEIIWECKVEGNISQVYINKNGYVAVIMSETSYKSVIQVFEPNGNPLFKKYLSTSMAVNLAISNDNKYLAIAEVDTSGTVIQSNIRVISIEKAKNDPVNSEEINYKSEANKLIVNIAYQDKNRIICMYTDSINIIKDNQEEVLFDNNNKKITSQSISLDNHFVTIQEENAGIFSANSIINIGNIDNKSIKNYNVETVIKEMYTKGNIIALNLGTEVELINTTGWLVKRYVASQEITNVTVSDSIVGIVYRDKIEIINL